MAVAVESGWQGGDLYDLASPEAATIIAMCLFCHSFADSANLYSLLQSESPMRCHMLCSGCTNAQNVVKSSLVTVDKQCIEFFVWNKEIPVPKYQQRESFEEVLFDIGWRLIAIYLLVTQFIPKLFSDLPNIVQQVTR